uniref:NAD-dependent epimerase/dehydratase domain-containing protein n=1 Tax=Amphora coffeiformis TaxID=265554 RepID=A0A7S3L685_9STRA|mmetsp:Transcript_5029/g.9592  ORF Transcript_5029/g.9592 Transcript_5029/m.9592 type:complete len:390 (-) Transcript_5029:32-1201(-)|eukprot:scaffold578_cov167-Amphora_coffeaeformis.AAC.18
MYHVAALLALFSASSVNAFTANPKARQTSALCASALIVQNKGGGHGELGYQLARVLEKNAKIDSITILQDEACKDNSEPFKSYSADLPNVKVIKAPLGDASMTAESMQSLLGDGTAFDYVWDNASKNAEGAGKAVCDCAKSWDVKLLTYVSSAGLYKPGADGPFPMPETTPIKESSGQNQYDQYAVELGLPLVSFRPQYIYGPKANKYDYIDWYFDRIVRGLPLPIPGDGKQLVSLTNSEDVASLLAAPLLNEEAAVQQRYFNCGTDQLVSYDEVAYLCADAANVARDQLSIEHYDADKFGKANFPFRLTNFYVAPDKAKEVLGWPGPSHSLKDDLPAYFESYKARGGPEKKMSLGLDWEIVVGSKTPMYDQVGSIYDKYDPIPLETSN